MSKAVIRRDRLAQIVKSNIEELCKQEKNGKTKIAEICHVSKASVSKWVSQNPSLPCAEYLYIIAEHFGVTVDWLMTIHDLQNMPGRIYTYSQAFLSLIALVENQTIQPKNIHDPVLKHLISRYREFNDSNIHEYDIAQWLHRISIEFNIPLPQLVDTEYYEDIAKNYPVKSINDDETYLNLARIRYDIDTGAIKDIIHYDIEDYMAEECGSDADDED